MRGLPSFWVGKVFGARVLEGSRLQPPFLTQKAGNKANGFRGGKQIGFLKNALALMVGGVIYNPGVESMSGNLFYIDSFSLMGEISHMRGP